MRAIDLVERSVFVDFQTLINEKLGLKANGLVTEMRKVLAKDILGEDQYARQVAAFANKVGGDHQNALETQNAERKTGEALARYGYKHNRREDGSYDLIATTGEHQGKPINSGEQDDLGKILEKARANPLK